MATATRRKPVRLNFSDGQVVVTPQDMDTFFISAERATEACKEAVKQSERVQQFQEEFLVPLYRWCTDHSAKVRACYLPVPSGSIRVFMVTYSPRYDFALGDDLAKLERSLQQNGWRVCLSQLPAASEESLGTFFSSEGALEVYAQGERAQIEGG